MKKGSFIFLIIALILFLSFSFVSASWFGDLWGKITGNQIRIQMNVSKAPMPDRTAVIPVAQCSDSDGNNIYTKGSVTYGAINYTDYCTDNLVVEYICESNQPKTANYTCPKLSACEDGACTQISKVPVQPAPVSIIPAKNLEISVATKKDTYAINEKIELTGAGSIIIREEPANYSARVSSQEDGNRNLFRRSSPATGQVVLDSKSVNEYNSISRGERSYQVPQFQQGKGIRISPEMQAYSSFQESSQSFYTINKFQSELAQFQQPQEFNGYIIELESPSKIEKQLELEEAAKEKTISEKKILKQIDKYSKQLKAKNKKTGEEILKTLKQEKRRDIPGRERKEFLQAEIKQEFTKAFNGFVLDAVLTPEQINEIEKIPDVKKVWPNVKVYALLDESVPLINTDDVWQIPNPQNPSQYLTGEGIKIGIIDTGVDYTHADLGSCTQSQFLSGNCNKVAGGYDFVNNDNNPIDDQGHGTHVAATAAGNGILQGVAPDAKIYAYKVLNEYGNGEADWIISGIEACADPNNDGDFSDKLDVCSMSLGGPGNPDDPMSQAAGNVVDLGVVFIIAAGNSGPEGNYFCGHGEKSICSPSTSEKVITVAASNKQDEIAGFSSRGPVIWEDYDGNIKVLMKPDVTAPGVNICAAQWDDAWQDRECLDNEHTSISGTSMATPHVAGAVALIKQAHPDWSPEEIKAVLRNTAVDIGEDIIAQGQGRIDVREAVRPTNLLESKTYAPPFELGWEVVIYPERKINNIYDELDIYGVFPENYTYLALEYKKTGEVSWVTNGVTLVVENSTVASFNPLGNILETGDYLFKIDVIKEGIEKNYTTKVHFDKDLRKGFPLDVSKALFWEKTYGYFGTTYWDINQDGNAEIFVSVSIKLGLIEFLNDSFSVKTLAYSLEPTMPLFLSRPSIADINNDGVSEIIFTEGASVAGRPYIPKSYVHVIELNGSYLPGWPVEIELVENQLSPLIIDFNDDGNKEIIIATGGIGVDTSIGNVYHNRKIYAFDKDGNLLPGWPVETSNAELIPSSSPILLENINGKKALAVGTKNISSPFDGSSIELFAGDGSPVNPFPYLDNHSSLFPWRIVSANINEGSSQEIISTNREIINSNAQSSAFTSDTIHGLAFSDLNDDKDIEILYLGGDPDSIYAVDSSGQDLPGWPPASFPTDEYVPRSIVVGSIDGINKIVFVGSNKGKLYAFNADGSLNFIKKFGSEVDLLLGQENSEIFLAGVDLDNNLYIWDLDGTYNPEKMDWPMFMHDAQNTGCYDCDKIQLKPESKIFNPNNFEVSGTLEMKLQKKDNSGNWQDIQIVANEAVSISANNLIKLGDKWNPQNVKANSDGDYRVYAGFEPVSHSGQKITAIWEFKVVKGFGPVPYEPVAAV